MIVGSIIFVVILGMLCLFTFILMYIYSCKEDKLQKKKDNYDKTHPKEYSLYLDANSRLEYLLSCYSSLYKNPLSCKDYEEYQNKLREFETQIKEQRQTINKYEQERIKSIK